MSVHWFRALTRSGQPCGLRFHCEICGLVIPHDCPAIVKHCNQDEPAPRKTEDLPTFRLGVPDGQQSLPANCVLLGWDDDVLPEPAPRMKWL